MEDSDLNLRVLSKSPQRLMAAPGLFEQHDQPLVPNDLHGLPSLDWDRPQHTHTWCLYGPDGAKARIDHKPRLVTDDLATLRRAALDGLGIVQLPLLVGGRDIVAGSLAEVLPGWAPLGGEIQAVFPTRRGLMPSVRALLDYL
jgi:DNA-binding transcriptional LysR family regulator